ncbi:hypothetical protein [Propioniferax innocua]|uniref:Uncharacterized protein n=1 Tax=Propioniferax innocua TaxID=1753 RepID=A0A542ZCA8_9ACTN|nr:hypothetical protein [Propioniferax innocua]TQL57993.1 hypothetical protein FB460_1844 [Propioniferax innocua]
MSNDLHLDIPQLTRALAKHPPRIPLPEVPDLWSAFRAASVVAPLQDQAPKRARTPVPFGQGLTGTPPAGYGCGPAFLTASKKVHGHPTSFLRVFVSLPEQLETPRTGKDRVRLTGRQVLTAIPEGWGLQIVAGGVKHWILPEVVAHEARRASEEIERDQRAAAHHWGLSVDPDAGGGFTRTRSVDGLETWLAGLGDLGDAKIRLLFRQMGERWEARGWAELGPDPIPETRLVSFLDHGLPATCKDADASDLVEFAAPPPAMIEALQQWRADDAWPGFGTWLSAVFTIDVSDAAPTLTMMRQHINSDHLPAFDPPLTAADLQCEQRRNPRTAWWMPDWFLVSLRPDTEEAALPEAEIPAPPSGVDAERYLKQLDRAPAQPASPRDPLRLGDFLDLKDQIQKLGARGFLANHESELPWLAAEFRRIAAPPDEEPISGLGNLLHIALRIRNDDEGRQQLVRALLAAGWPVSTCRAGSYNELLIFLDSAVPDDVEDYVELIMLLLRAGCHPSLMDRFGQRLLTRLGTPRMTRHDLKPVLDVVFSRDDLELTRIDSSGGSALRVVRQRRRVMPDRANRVLAWLMHHGHHVPFLGEDPKTTVLV